MRGKLILLGFIFYSLPSVCVAQQAVTVDPSVVEKAVQSQAAKTDDPAELARRAKLKADQSEWMKVRNQHRAQENNDAASAIAAYQSFVTSGKWHPEITITVSDLIARLQLFKLNNAPAAQKIYDWLHEKYLGDPQLIRTVPGRAKLLNSQKKYAEANQLLKTNWEKVLPLQVVSHEYVYPALEAWNEALTALKQRDQLIIPFTQAFSAVPLMLDWRDDQSRWAYQTIVDILVETKRPQEALSWARMAFAQCAYSAQNITATSRLIVDAWKKIDADGKKWEDFAASQSDSNIENPLLKIPLPQLDEKLWSKTYKPMATNTTYQHYIVTLLIARGFYGDAMKVAEKMAADRPQSTLGVMEGSRIFKAVDLNLLRANQMIASLKQEASDPLPSFYAANPPGKPNEIKSDDKKKSEVK